MAGNVDIARKAYEDFGNGDVEAALSSWADDIVWQGPNSEELPDGGEHSGKQAATETLQKAVGSYDEFTLHMDEFFEGGETVVALGHAHASKGGTSVQAPVVHILRFEGGKVKRFQIINDTLQNAKLLGIV